MYVYVISVGLTVEAVLSCVWISAEKYGVPARICLVFSGRTYAFKDSVSRALRTLFPNVHVDYIVVDEASVDDIVESVSHKLVEYKDAGFDILVDVTPGRKTMSIGLYVAAQKCKANKVVYLQLKDRSFEGILYPLIPKPYIRQVVLLGNRD